MCLQGAQEYTYDQFSKAVLKIAEALGPVYPDDRVALLLERDASMVAAIYGVLSAGGCYVPLEPDYPLERLKTVVEDAACKACVTQAYLRAGVLATFFSELERPSILNHIVELDVLDPFNPDRVMSPYEPGPAKPKNLAYVFYTSGTTGKPKGVMVEHRGLVRRIAWFQRRYPLTSSDMMLLKTTYTFGISEWELFWAPTVGASTLVAGAQDHKDASTIASLLQNSPINLSVASPSGSLPPKVVTIYPFPDSLPVQKPSSPLPLPSLPLLLGERWVWREFTVVNHPPCTLHLKLLEGELRI